MKTDFPRILRGLRRQRQLTQEQLGEALGFTAGAVYKWEQGLSVPDVATVMELARFFGLSLDGLMGFEPVPGEKERIRLALREFRQNKSYGEAWDTVEQWLRRYPNDYEIVSEAGILYELAGSETGDPRCLSRAIALLTHACALLPRQEGNPAVRETELRRRIAAACLDLGRREEGLQLLRDWNPCGISDDLLGLELSEEPGRSREARDCLARALTQGTVRLQRTLEGLLNLEQGRVLPLLEVFLQWLRALETPGKPSFFNRDRAILLGLRACLLGKAGDREGARRSLREALAEAAAFDAAPDYTSRNMPFRGRGEPITSFDSGGPTALEAVTRTIYEETAPEDPVRELWKEVSDENQIHPGVHLPVLP